MSTGEQAHLGPPIGLELRVASPEGIRDTCTPWHCAGAARHIVPTQHLRHWAGVSFGRASVRRTAHRPGPVPALWAGVSFREVPCRSAALWAPVPRSARGVSRVLYGELPGGSWQSLPPPYASRAGETSGADGPARQVRASALFVGTASHS